MRRAATDYRIPIGRDTWAISDQGEMGKIAASGAWESEDTYILKVYYCETPYCSVQHFRFNEDLFVLNEEFNVSFGKRVRPQRHKEANHSASTKQNRLNHICASDAARYAEFDRAAHCPKAGTTVLRQLSQTIYQRLDQKGTPVGN